MFAAHRAISPLLPQSTRFEWLAFEGLEAPALKAGAAYWTALRGDRRFPARGDLVPRQMAGLMPYMSLLKVVDGGADFHHRIVGDVMVRAFNVPIQNRSFSEIAVDAPDFVARCLVLFRKVVDTGEPLAWRSVSGRDAVNVMFSSAEVLLLPLGTGDTVDHVLGFGSHKSGAPR